MKRASCLIVAAVIAACFAACGGGSTASTSSPAAAAQPSVGDAGTTSAKTTQGTAGSPSGHPESEASERAAYEKKRYGSPSSQSAPFSKYSGKGKVKLHLAEYGAEASSGERERAQAALEAYLQASREGEWARACGYLHSSVKAELEGAGSGCEEVLPQLITATTKGPPYYGAADVVSLRIEKGAGFALFHGSDEKDYWGAMKLEGGDWKVLTVVPQPFR